MKLLITGGAGCLGSNLVEKYICEGHDVLVIDNFSTSDPAVLPRHLSLLKIVNGHIADKALVQKCFAEFEPTHVIHSAASYKDPNDWYEDVSTNISGTIIVAELAKEYNVKRFVNFQTALCYGNPQKVPIPVDHPMNPLTSYGISKTAGEQYLFQTGLPVVSLRLANICAPRLSIGPIPTFYQRLKAGKGCFCSDSTRDFLDVSDFFRLIDEIIKPGAPSGFFNVSTGEGKSIKKVYDAVVNYLNIESTPNVPIVPVGDDDVQSVVLDPTETEKVFGWKAQIGFEDMIGRLLTWYDKHGVNTIYSHLAQPVKDD